MERTRLLDNDVDRYELVFRHAVKVGDISEIQRSKVYTVNGLSWQVNTRTRSGREENAEEFLCLYLNCSSTSDSIEWKCSTKATFNLLKCSGPPLSRTFRHQFCPNDTTWGFSKFTETKRLMEPANKFISNDCVVFEVHLKAEVENGKRGGLPLPSRGSESTLLRDVGQVTSLGTNQKKRALETDAALLGFSNLGNSCFVNGVLQALFCLVPFTSDLQTLACTRFSSGPGGVLCRTMASLLMDKLNDRDQLLKKVKELAENSSKSFSGHEQCDAHEFLTWVLDQLKEEVNHLTAADSLEGSVQADGCQQSSYDPTARNFEAEMQQRITCSKCNQDSYNSVIIRDIALVVTSGSKGLSIQDLIREYFKPSSIEFFCSNCKFKQATITYEFLRLPRIIILLLKRYHCDAFGNRKITENILIPRNIFFKDQCNQDTCPPTELGASPYEEGKTVWCKTSVDNSKEGKKINVDNSEPRVPTDRVQLPSSTEVAEELILQQTDEEAENFQNMGTSEAEDDDADDLLIDTVELEELKKAAETGELPYSYRLMSIVNHFGGNTSLGHYVTDVFDINGEQWYTCDDSHVSLTSEKTVLTTRKKTGYMLFYLSKGIEDELKEYRRTSSLHC